MSLLPLALQAIREGEGSPAYQALSEAAAQGDRPYPYIIAVDFDSGASEVNQLNRIKLMLSTAKKNM